MNIGNATIQLVTPWYMIVIYSLIGLFGVGTLAMLAFLIIPILKKKKA
ncbi:MAG: hypothetical protein J6N95_00905 [Bacilli bacterium]|nr:hypothetical protein [Bacilli bacterium]